MKIIIFQTRWRLICGYHGKLLWLILRIKKNLSQLNNFFSLLLNLVYFLFFLVKTKGKAILDWESGKLMKIQIREQFISF